MTIPFDYVLFILFWGSGGCRSHVEGGTLKEKIQSKKKREALLAGFWSLNCPVGIAVFIFTLSVPANSCMEDGNFNPRIHDLLYSNFSLHFAKVSSLSVTLEEKKKKILHSYTHNRFQHTALNLECFAF